MATPTVFISYSHKDEKWKDRLRTHLKVLELNGRISIWDDRDIDVGGEWFDEIGKAMDQAAVAVCLISADYLASDFCHKEEIPHLLGLRKDKGMILIPILLRPCPWKAVPWLKKTQMMPRDGKIVSKDFEGNEDEVFAEVAEDILEILDDPTYQPPPPPPSRWSPPEKIDIGRLPVTGRELFGRRAELELLDAAWDSEGTHVVSLVAWGGVGKSTLANKWLEQLEADNYRGARRVYAWSFYSQGTNERVTSADLFINNALEFFGDPDPTAGSPWDKGERLARLVQEEKTLLLLDGLEPLQSPHAHERGKIKDPALSTLLTELARGNQGLCLITTREPVTDLAELSETVVHKDLEQISDEAGRALLRVGGVRGTDAELKQATRGFGNHALAVQLLAVYLHDIPGHHVSHAADIPDLDIPVESGKHPRRMLAAFEQLFGDGPEVELLRMLGLFDRPADAEALAALRAAPPIPGLTDRVQNLSEAGWLRVTEKLRRAKLIAPASRHHLNDDLDAHPLVREHFGEQLKRQYPAAWGEGNSRLYEYIRDNTEELPDRLEDMSSLFAAITHGCQAGRHQEALDTIFYERVDRGKAFVAHNLGAMGTVLSALSNFFLQPYAQLVPELDEEIKPYLLSVAGFCLRSLSRLREATEITKASLEGAIKAQYWEGAAISASSLNDLYTTIGDLSQALEFGKQGVMLADRSSVPFQRFARRAALAQAQYRVGHLAEAEAGFREAEEIRKEYVPSAPFSNGLPGYWYCELLLYKKNFEEVQARVTQMAEISHSDGGLLGIALTNILQGHLHLRQSVETDQDKFAEATSCLRQGVDFLRQAAQLDELPRGLLARAGLHRMVGDFEDAHDDLSEVMTIATRGDMGLHQADCHLEYARLCLAEGEREKARGHWEKARGMVERMGYHLRDGDVEEIGRALGEV